MRRDGRVLHTGYIRWLEDGLLETCKYKPHRRSLLTGSYERALREGGVWDTHEHQVLNVERDYESVTGGGPRSVRGYASFVIALITKLGLPLEKQRAHTQRVREELKRLLERRKMGAYAVTLAVRLLRDTLDTADTLQRCIDGSNKTMIIITCCSGENLITSLPLEVQEKILEELPGESHLKIGIFSEERDRLRLPDSLTAEDMNAEPASRAALRAQAALQQMLGTGPATTPSVPQSAKTLSDIPEEILCGMILSGLPSVALARWSETSREHMRATSGVREEVKIQMCTLDPKTYFPYVTADTQMNIEDLSIDSLILMVSTYYAQYASQEVTPILSVAGDHSDVVVPKLSMYLRDKLVGLCQDYIYFADENINWRQMEQALREESGGNLPVPVDKLSSEAQQAIIKIAKIVKGWGPMFRPNWWAPQAEQITDWLGRQPPREQQRTQELPEMSGTPSEGLSEKAKGKKPMRQKEVERVQADAGSGASHQNQAIPNKHGLFACDEERLSMFGPECEKLDPDHFSEKSLVINLQSLAKDFDTWLKQNPSKDITEYAYSKP